MPGGWSEWSSWSACNQANSNGEQPDQCMCSVRQCNNPVPQNGGAYCEGVSILVISNECFILFYFFWLISNDEGPKNGFC